MKRRPFALWILPLAVATMLEPLAFGAEATRILSSFDDGDPFDMDIQIGYRRTMKRAKITQEYHTGSNLVDVLALRYSSYVHEMPMDVRIGIYKDLELNVSTSMIFSKHQMWRLPTYIDIDKGEHFDPASSTVLHNRIDPYGNVSTTDIPLIDLDNNNQSYRAGLSDITVGIKWTPFQEGRDQYMPTWLLGFEWTIPTASINRPSDLTSAGDKGNIGDGVHRLTFSTAFSKRFGMFDPYVSGWYSLPIGAHKRYSNCDNAEALPFGGNCADPAWTEDDVALDAPHQGGLFLGTEFLPWSRKDTDQKVSIDLRAGATFVGSGRTYNELSDAFGKVLWTEGHVKLGGSLGLTIQPVKFFSMHADVGLWHETAHLISGESVGKDIDGKCSDSSFTDGCIDTGSTSNEVNPNFDFRYDVAGRRFRVEATSVFVVNAYIRAQF